MRRRPRTRRIRRAARGGRPRIRIDVRNVRRGVSGKVESIFKNGARRRGRRFPRRSVSVIGRTNVAERSRVPRRVVGDSTSRGRPRGIPRLRTRPRGPKTRPVITVGVPRLGVPTSVGGVRLDGPPGIRRITRAGLGVSSFNLRKGRLGLRSAVLTTTDTRKVRVPGRRRSGARRMRRRDSRASISSGRVGTRSVSRRLRRPSFLDKSVRSVGITSPGPSRRPGGRVPIRPRVRRTRRRSRIARRSLEETRRRFLRKPVKGASLGPRSSARKARRTRPLARRRRLRHFVRSVRPRGKTSPESVMPERGRLASSRGRLFACFMGIPNVGRRLISALCSMRVTTTSGASGAKGVVIVNNGRYKGAELVSNLVPTVYGRLGLRTSGMTCIFTSRVGKGGVCGVFSGLTNNFLMVRGTGRLAPRAMRVLSGTVRIGASKLAMVIRSRGVNVQGLVTECPGFTGGFASVVGVPIFAGSRLIGFTEICAGRGNCTVSRVKVLTLCGLVKVGRGRSSPVGINTMGRLVSTTVTGSRKKVHGFGQGMSGGHVSESKCVILCRGSFAGWYMFMRLRMVGGGRWELYPSHV